MRRSTPKKKQYKFTFKFKHFLVWLITVVVSAAYIYIAHSIDSDGLNIFNMEGAYVEKAEVTRIADIHTDEYSLSEDIAYQNVETYFYCELLTGEQKGSEILAVQTSDNYTVNAEQAVSVGDRIILFNYGDTGTEYEWIFGGYARSEILFIFGAVFFLLLLLFGQLKGLNTIISLSFTVLAVFNVFIPSVLNGYNVYIMSIITCVFTIIMTLLITNGATSKSLATIL